jgi:hypothetical protein
MSHSDWYSDGDVLQTWWRIEAIDPLVGQDWVFRVPAESESIAGARLWKFGLHTGRSTRWRPLVDPLLEQSKRDWCQMENLWQNRAPCTVAPQGQVWNAVFGATLTLASALDSVEVEADPQDRHYLFQAFVDPRRYPSLDAPDSDRMWACWHWMAEWPQYVRRWLRKDSRGQCLTVPLVHVPGVLAILLRERGDTLRAEWLESVQTSIDAISGNPAPTAIPMW